MRRITYIEAIESIQGQLGTRQKLQYAESNNPAWYSPDLGKNTARNYNIRFIGMRRTLSGRNYYAVRAKSTYHKTMESMLACAIMGATASICNALLHDLMKLTGIQQNYLAYKSSGGTDTLYRWLFNILRPQIADGEPRLMLAGLHSTMFLGGNPYVGQQTEYIELPYETFRKFAQVLDNKWRPLYIVGLGAPALFYSGEDWYSWIMNPNSNSWGFQAVAQGEEDYIKKDNYWLYNEANQKVSVDDAVSGLAYHLGT